MKLILIVFSICFLGATAEAQNCIRKRLGPARATTA